jgi:uncharacterized protein involved in type VI secretion and phage assembly
MSITGIFEQGRRSESKIYGVIVGIVTNNKDPDSLGRVKVKIPRISGKDESNWARVISFMAGKERGAFYLPEVDDEVLVAFEYGDINIPYVIGSLWNGKDKPPLTNDDGKNNLRIIKSRSGHVVRFDDTDGNEKIEIVDKTDKNKIVVDSKENKISIISEKDLEISAPNGKVIIGAKEIEVKSSESTKVEAKGIEVKASESSKIEAKGIEVKASESTKIEAKGIEVKASESTKIEAKDIEAKASASAKVEASSSMDLKASGTMTIKGATVNIN